MRVPRTLGQRAVGQGLWGVAFAAPAGLVAVAWIVRDAEQLRRIFVCGALGYLSFVVFSGVLVLSGLFLPSLYL